MAGIVALPALVCLCAVEGLRTRARRRRGEAPRLLWGPTPVISITYWSAALQARNYESVTFADTVWDINQRDDFDVHRDEFLKGIPLVEFLRYLVIFAWALRRADVFLTYFDGGYLRESALRWLELPLLRLAGKKVIVSPYGSDIAVIGELGPAEAALLRDYPTIAENSDAVRRRVLHFCRRADLVVRNYQFGFIPRWDVVWPTQIAIDTHAWRPNRVPSRFDGRNGEVLVLHAPNHRHIKGTEHLIATVDQLNDEGLRVRLELIERRPNEEVRAAVHACDIVADQFIAGYALFAIEGMSVGRPVMSALSWMPAEVRAALRDCPIVDTDVESLVENLRRLVQDPELRDELGHAGREFVSERHGLDPVGRVWVSLIEHVWRGSPLPSELAGTSGSADGP